MAGRREHDKKESYPGRERERHSTPVAQWAQTHLEQMAAKLDIRHWANVAHVLTLWQRTGQLGRHGATKADVDRAQSLYDSAFGRDRRYWS